MVTLKRCALVGASIACLFSAPAAADLYAMFSAGNATVDETGDFAVPGLAFAGPVIHDICNDQATITVGARPTVGRLEDHDALYRFGIGWRGDGAWAFEFGYFNVGWLASRAASGPYAVAQPACPDFTVDARGIEIDRMRASGLTFAPVYNLGLGARFELDMRAIVNVYDLKTESQWQVEVTELENGTPLRTFPTAAVTGDRDGHEVDLGYGLGLSYRLGDETRLRAGFERQALGELALDVALLGLSVDF